MGAKKKEGTQPSQLRLAPEPAWSSIKQVLDNCGVAVEWVVPTLDGLVIEGVKYADKISAARLANAFLRACFFAILESRARGGVR